MPHPVVDAANRYRAQLLAQERAAATRLVQAYGRTFAALQDQMAVLQVAMVAQESWSQAEARRIPVIQSLMRQVAVEVERYAAFADIEIANGVQAAIELGLQGSMGTVQAHFANPRTQAAIGARWDMLAAESVETMLGYTATDSPLRQALVGRLGPTVAERVSDALVQAIAVGVNPREVARIFRREMGLGLTWSLNTARTAQVYAYRDATRLNYMANRDIVAGWHWQAALDDRTCVSCWAMHGTRHGVDELLNDHHSGRCVPVPIVPLAQRLGITPPDMRPGEDHFGKLTPQQQRAVMGPSMWEAWQRGEFDFRDLSKPYNDPIYGDMLRGASLTDLLGETKARTYIDMARGG